MNLLVHDAPSDLDAEALIKEARRLRRRRLRTIALVVLALAAGIGLALAAGGPSGSPRTNSPSGSASGASSGMISGANTTVVVWPGTACCEQDNNVYFDDLTTGKVSLVHVGPFSGGDIPYSVVSVGRWFVYLGEADNPGVWTVRDDFKGRPRLLGNATLFAPSALPGHVWLINAAAVGFVESVRSASVSTGRLGPTISLPKRTNLIEGTVRGLLLESFKPDADGSDLELWRPGRPPTRIGYAAHGVDDLMTANANLVASGTGCKNATSTAGPAPGPIAYRLCTRLRVIDFRSGKRFTVPAPSGTLGWEPVGYYPVSVGAIAPGEVMFAAQAGLAPARAGNARLYVVDLNGGAITARPVPVSSGPPGVTTWSNDGSWLLYAGRGSSLRAFQTTTGKVRSLNPRVGKLAIVLVSVPR